MSDDKPNAPDHEPETPPSSILDIERIVPGGDGIARHPDGFVVFVPRTAPGDRVEIAYTEAHRQWRRGRVLRIVDPGPERREAPCAYYGRCGGCQLQHLHYPAQLSAKRDIIVDCLRRIGGLEVDTSEVSPSPNQFAYRNRVSFVARYSDDGFTGGYHGFEDPDAVVDVAACPLAEDAVNAVWATLRERLAETRGTVADARQSPSELRLTLRANGNGRVGLAVEGTSPAGDVAKTISATPGLDAVWWLDHRGRIVADTGDAELTDRWGTYDIPLKGAAFLQVNRLAAAMLDQYVHAQCEPVSGRRIIDAYCGAGTRAMDLARAGAIATGIDIDRYSITTASRLAADLRIPVHFVAAGVERALPAQLPADVLIVNPPRRGMDRGAISAIEKQPPALILYVSCNPATLARDVKRLGARYALGAYRAFDLFPQTAHVETVASLVCR